jgi:aldehyde:ferredoxin oxidoreductase
MIYGYNQKLLRVNLSKKSFTLEPIDEDTIKNFIGGRGFVAKYLFDEIKPGTVPLSEDNKVIMAIGPLSGNFLPSSGKTEFGSKSPLTGGYGDSNMGGHIASELKLAGYDVVIIEGKCDHPSYLYIDNDQIELRDASKYWGFGALTTEKMLKDDLGGEFQIVTIGPAGENLVKYACLSHDFGRQGGRTGIGAVLGYKRLKAIAVRGGRSVPVADPDGLYNKGLEMYREVYNLPGFKTWTPYGTADITKWVNDNGSFPTKNFSRGYFEGAKNLTGQVLREKIHVLDKGCFSCPIPCGKYSKVCYKGDEVFVEGPEYETIALVGGKYMTCDIGAHHNRAWAITYDIAVGRYEVEGKPEKVIEMQHVRPMLDSLNVCRFPWIEISFELHHYRDIFKYVTGMDFTWDDLLRVGEREFNLTRAFNVREIPDFGREYDYPPARFYKEKLEGDGPTVGGIMPEENIIKMLDKYYELRGWTENGIPTRQKLEELDLKYVADQLNL